MIVSRKRMPAFHLLVGLFLLFLVSTSIHGPERYDSAAMMRDARRVWEHGLQMGPGEHPNDVFSKYGLGQALLNLAVIWVDTPAREGDPGLPQLLVLNALPSLLAAAYATLVFLVAGRLGYSRQVSLWIGILTGLATMTWVYAQILFADPTVGLCWILSCYALLRFRDGHRSGWLALAGFAAGYAVLVKPIAICGLPVIFLYGGWLIMRLFPRSGRRPAVISFATFIIPFVLIALVMMAFNQFRYGSPWNSGYSVIGNRDTRFGFNVSMLSGLYGMLFSSGKGFFFYNPVAVLGLLGLTASWRRHRAETSVLLALPLMLILAHSKWWAWHGDWAWGPRFLAGTSGFWVLLGAPVISAVATAVRERTAGWRLKLAAIIATAVVSAGVQILGLLFEPSNYIMLTTSEVKPFGHGFYDAETYPVPNDGLHRHFIPEFSPLAGHLWLLSCALIEQIPLEMRPAYPEVPWATLNPQWVPKSTRPNTVLKVWWLWALQWRLEYWWQKTLGAAVLAIAGIAFLMKALRGCRQ